MYGDHAIKSVREAAILTTGYVAGTVIEANEQNQLVILLDFTKGSLTTAELKVEFSEKRTYALAYDGQTANFTAGAVVRGKTSGATAKIISDVDGGVAGTLTVSNVKGTFMDDEVLVDNLGGAAVVNGTISENTSWHQETAASVTGGTKTNTLVEHQFSATGNYRIAIPIKDRYIKISVKGTGTVTSSSAKVGAIVGAV